jgi:hypothetical protein
MCEGYNTDANDYSGLEDEFLCEYVDGTMDPLVRDVFEEYLGMNPDLRDHIRCLQNTRMLLCRYGCRCRAPRDLHERLRREISCELMSVEEPFHLVLSDHLRSFASVTSAISLLFLVGMIAGVSVFDMDLTSGVPATGAAVFGGQSSHGKTVDRSATTPQIHAVHPGLSSFAPVPVVGSLVSSNSGIGWHHMDTSTAVLQGSRLAP